MDPNLQEFTNPALYDAENRWGAADDFYLALTRQVGGPVLDVACGTGRLVLQPQLWRHGAITNDDGQRFPASFVVTTARLQPLGSAPMRPAQT
jgi:1,6-anhydro-N-acetylmuramate kinase